jgi:hypothetical protein
VTLKDGPQKATVSQEAALKRSTPQEGGFSKRQLRKRWFPKEKVPPER